MLCNIILVSAIHQHELVIGIHMSQAYLVAQTVKRLPTVRETRVQSWVGKIPCRRKWQPTPVFLPGKSHGLSILVGYSPWGRKESDMTEWLHFTSLHFVHMFRPSWTSLPTPIPFHLSKLLWSTSFELPGSYSKFP